MNYITKTQLRRLDTNTIVAERTEPPFTPIEWKDALPWPVTVQAEVVDLHGNIYTTSEFTTDPEPDWILEVTPQIVSVEWSVDWWLPDSPGVYVDWGDDTTSQGRDVFKDYYYIPGNYTIRVYGMKRIISLDLDRREWPFGLAKIAELTNIKELTLHWNQDGDISTLSTLINLEEFYANSSPWLTGDIAGLVTLPNIKILDLSWCGVNDFSGGEIQSNQLQQLNLQATQLQAPALGRLVDALHAHKDILGANFCVIRLNSTPGSAEVAVTHAEKLNDLAAAGCTVVI